eukprot:Mrub_07074.p1 GENE.Mrub_07074~~Mrub_07074.p1  ORF type:complete len:306 (+),score=43.63 Mrub_07074:59-919(+)
MKELKEHTKKFVLQKNIKSGLAKLVKVIRIEGNQGQITSNAPQSPTDSKIFVFPTESQFNIPESDLPNLISYPYSDKLEYNLPVFIIVEDTLNITANYGFRILNEKYKAQIHYLYWFEVYYLCMSCKCVIQDMTFTETRVEIIKKTMIAYNMNKKDSKDKQVYSLFKSKIYQVYSKLKDLNYYLTFKSSNKEELNIEKAISYCVQDKLVFYAWDNYQDYISDIPCKYIFYVFINGKISGYNSKDKKHEDEKKIRLVVSDSCGIYFYSCVGSLTELKDDPRMVNENN